MQFIRIRVATALIAAIYTPHASNEARRSTTSQTPLAKLAR